MDTVKRVIEIKMSQGAEDVETWKYFQELLEYLSTSGMSSEEEGSRKIDNRTVPVFLVRLCMWRADEVSNYLSWIDDATNSPAICGTRSSRALPRIRMEVGGKLSMPVGLPKKLYNQEWLALQEKERPYYVKEELRVSEAAFDLLALATTSDPTSD
jgi:hypothetical protein